MLCPVLKCFVLIDLKVGDLTHQDLGQMQMYVHYYERELMNEGDNPPIGIVLCADKSESVVKYTLPEDETQIFASKYKLYLPSEEELIQELNQEIRRWKREKQRKKSDFTVTAIYLHYYLSRVWLYCMISKVNLKRMLNPGEIYRNGDEVRAWPEEGAGIIAGEGSRATGSPA